MATKSTKTATTSNETTEMDQSAEMELDRLEKQVLTEMKSKHRNFIVFVFLFSFFLLMFSAEKNG